MYNMKKVLTVLLSLVLVQQAFAQQSECVNRFKPDIAFYQDGLAWIEPYAWNEIGSSMSTCNGMPVISRCDMDNILKVAYNPSQRCYDAKCIKDIMGVTGNWAGSEWSLVLFDNDDYNYMQGVTNTGLSDANATMDYKYHIDDVKVNFDGGKVAHKELHMQVHKADIDRAHHRALKLCMR